MGCAVSITLAVSIQQGDIPLLYVRRTEKLPGQAPAPAGRNSGADGSVSDGEPVVPSTPERTDGEEYGA